MIVVIYDTQQWDNYWETGFSHEKNLFICPPFRAKKFAFEESQDLHSVLAFAGHQLGKN